MIYRAYGTTKIVIFYNYLQKATVIAETTPPPPRKLSTLIS